MTADTGKKFEMLTEKLKGKKKKAERGMCVIFSQGTKSSMYLNNFSGQDGK